MEELKFSGGMTGKKKKKSGKGFLIFLLIVIVAAAGISVYRSHERTVYATEGVVADLLGDSELSRAYNEEDYPRFKKRFEEVKDSSHFQKALAEGMDHVTQVTMSNSLFEQAEDKKAVQQEREDDFGVKASFSERVEDMPRLVGVLTELGYEDETLRDSLKAFYKGYGDYIKGKEKEEKKKGGNLYAYTAELTLAVGNVEEFNEKGGEFYKIDPSIICEPEELQKRYDHAVKMLLEKKDLDTLATALSAAAKCSYTKDRTYVDGAKLLELYTGGSPNVVSLLANTGSFYDTKSNREALKEMLKKNHKEFRESAIYGDFYYYRTGDAAEAPEPPVSAEEKEAHKAAKPKADPNAVAYFRNIPVLKEVPVSAFDIREMAEAGMEYAVLREDGQFVFVGREQMNVSVSTGRVTIEGDYASVLQKLAGLYKENPAVDLNAEKERVRAEKEKAAAEKAAAEQAAAEKAAAEKAAAEEEAARQRANRTLTD